MTVEIIAAQYEPIANQMAVWYGKQTTTDLVWLGVGFFAQTMFMMRFVVQWIASERIKRSIVPETFWYFSLFGGMLLLAYSLWKVDPVFIMGQALGTVIYARNIYFIWSHKRATTDVDATGTPS